MAHPTIGNNALTLSLHNQRGERVNRKDYTRKHIVVRHCQPKAMTPGCTTQACGIRDTQNELAQRDTVVFGVSPDPVERLQKFIDKQDLNFDLLSDEDHALADKYGVWALKKFMGKEFMGIVRTTFIIDKESRLVGVMDSFRTKTHHDDLLAYLDENI